MKRTISVIDGKEQICYIVPIGDYDTLVRNQEALKECKAKSAKAVADLYQARQKIRNGKAKNERLKANVDKFKKLSISLGIKLRNVRLAVK